VLPIEVVEMAADRSGGDEQMLMRFDPWRELDRLTADAWSDRRVPRMMPMDAYRHDDAFLVVFDVPGIDPESIELTVEKNVLTVSVRRAFDRSELDEILVSERPQGVFSRQVFLGDGLDIDALEATYDAGVLTVKVPVLEAAKPRRIPITVGESGQTAIETSAENKERTTA
jgi:HSP20 family protein